MRFLFAIHAVYGALLLGGVVVTTLVIRTRLSAMKPAQMRMARAALNWSLQDLAVAAGVHRNTLYNFETGKFAGDPEKLEEVRLALEKAGVEFIEENGGGPGVRLKKEFAT